MERTKDIKEMTDEELESAIAEKYGEDWDPKKVDANDELIVEWVFRLVNNVY